MEAKIEATDQSGPSCQGHGTDGDAVEPTSNSCEASAASDGASSESESNDNSSSSDYHDYAMSMAPAGYASIPKADRDVVFASKLLCMLEAIEEDGLDQVVGWQPHGRCFLVRDHRLILQVLLKYLKISKWATFHRQLYVYGFKRITQGPDKGAYYHEKFLRGRPFLAAQMTRVSATRGARGRKKVSQEPDFWSMPWVKPIEPSAQSAASGSLKKLAPPTRAPVPQESTMPPMVSASSSRTSPPPIQHEQAISPGTPLRDERLALANNPGLPRRQEVVYIREPSGELVRVQQDQPMYTQPQHSHVAQYHLQQSHHPRAMASPPGSNAGRLFVHGGVPVSAVPVTPPRIPFHHDRSEGGAMVKQMPYHLQSAPEESMAVQHPMAVGGPGYTRSVLGSGSPASVLLSPDRSSLLDTRTMASPNPSSPPGLYASHYREQQVLHHSGHHLSIRSAQANAPLTHQPRQDYTKEQWPMGPHQGEAAAAHNLVSPRTGIPPQPSFNLARGISGGESWKGAPPKSVPPTSLPRTVSARTSSISSSSSSSSSSSVSQAKRDMLLNPGGMTKKTKFSGTTVKAKAPAPSGSKNDTEQQVAMGLLMLGSN